MEFGSPPSGEFPILFNDHHVYAKPDTLRQGRVLAALVRGGTILIPLRSMFEQMGATVSYDPASKTVDVTKAGADVRVTVGRPEVTINGETRPLDVPPMIYQGQVLVPVRVISEGMGAYVQWVPDRRIVVVRYLPPTPPPPPAPAPPPATPSPTPVPVAAPFYDRYVAGDYIFSPKVYNEFSPGNSGNNFGPSYGIRGGLEFKFFRIPFMVAGDFRQYRYPHNCGAVTDPECFVTTIGRTGQVFVPAFTAEEKDIDARLGIKIADPHIYIAASYLWRSTNYGYPVQRALGFGLEKLPDLNHIFSVYGSIYYYPNLSGTCATAECPRGPFGLAYNLLKYQIGGTVGGGAHFPVFLDFGWLGDSGHNKAFAPSDFTHNGPYAGIGIHF
jgi:hypothetical protein